MFNLYFVFIMKNVDFSTLQSVLNIVSQCQVPLFGVYTSVEKQWSDLPEHLQFYSTGFALLDEVETLQSLYDSLSLFCKNLNSFIHEQNKKALEKG